MTVKTRPQGGKGDALNDTKNFAIPHIRACVNMNDLFSLFTLHAFHRAPVRSSLQFISVARNTLISMI